MTGLPQHPTVGPAFPVVRVVAATGGLLVLVSVFLGWILGVNAVDVPLEALWSDTAVDGFGLGWLLLALGGLGLGLSFVAAAAPWRRIAGLLGAGLAAALIARLVILVADRGGSTGDALGLIGMGPWVAIAGGLLLLLSPAGRALSRPRSDR